MSTLVKLTISSLHIGHTSLLEALAAAFSPWPNSTLLPISSLVSAVLAGLLDVCELRETELSEGDSRLVLRRCWVGGLGETAGDRCLPLPSTRPPPRDLPEVMIAAGEESGACSSEVEMRWECGRGVGPWHHKRRARPGKATLELAPRRRDSFAGLSNGPGWCWCPSHRSGCTKQSMCGCWSQRFDV